MKKILLGMTLLCSIASAQAKDYNYPTLKDATTYNGKYSPVATPVVFSPDGTTVYQTGLYDDMVMIGDDILENIATSAFISAVDNKQDKPLWTVGIKGAAHITAITATDDAIFVAGTFADDIILGSRDFNEVSLTGTSLSHDMVNGFMAKYSSAGNLIAAKALMPQENSAYADKETYESDLSISPTAITVMGERAYVSFVYLGGYSIDDIKVDGTLKSSFGFWDNACAAVISASATDLSATETVLDMRNSAAVNENGMRPQSICLTTDGKALYVATFACGSNDITIGSEKSNVSFFVSEEEQEYGAAIITIRDGKADIKKINAANSSRAYVSNKINSMTIAGDELYMAGHVSTPLPFSDALVPDLWTDQFAVCLNTADMSSKWAYITNAKRDDIATSNGKYRESIGAALSGNIYSVIGATNFSCDQSALSPEHADMTCLGIATNGSMQALAEKTAEGSKLTIGAGAVGIDAVDKAEQEDDSPAFDLSGHPVTAPSKGQVIIRANKTVIAQ
ncbi:MAG: hypothetical protein Q4P12_00925 [Bacteroidales bacterium]|nr:hypothetical protein [Bacteroidales bacterium]